jgi:hypothetical protein
MPKLSLIGNWFLGSCFQDLRYLKVLYITVEQRGLAKFWAQSRV